MSGALISCVFVSSGVVSAVLVSTGGSAAANSAFCSGLLSIPSSIFDSGVLAVAEDSNASALTDFSSRGSDEAALCSASYFAATASSSLTTALTASVAASETADRDCTASGAELAGIAAVASVPRGCTAGDSAAAMVAA